MSKYTIEPVRNGYVVTLSYEGEDNKLEQESYVYETLKAVYEDTHDERYKICPMLKTIYLKNGSFYN